jgi:hypothetical protein
VILKKCRLAYLFLIFPTQLSAQCLLDSIELPKGDDRAIFFFAFERGCETTRLIVHDNKEGLIEKTVIKFTAWPDIPRYVPHSYFKAWECSMVRPSYTWQTDVPGSFSCSIQNE